MDSQIAKKNQSLTTAEQMRNQTKLVMQPYVNWEEYLTPAPLSIAILGELVFISSKEDFSINKNPPKDGYKYIRYPDSFRACLMQVCNSGWGAFNEAHKNMDQIRLHTMTVPDYIKTAVKILFQGNDKVVEALLTRQLKSIDAIADDCLGLANATEKSFKDVINIIQELLEVCINAKFCYGEELDAIKKKLDEAKMRKEAAEEAAKRSEKDANAMEEQFKHAHESYNKAMDSLPSEGEIDSMDFGKTLSFLFSRLNINFCLDKHQAHLDKSRELYDNTVENMEKNQKELTEILITMRNCKVEEIDFNTTIQMLVKGMEAMGRVKEQWEKMVHFFQMVSNIVKTRLNRTLKDFTSTSEMAQLFPDDPNAFKDLLYNQAFQATNIASLVHMISATYTEVSSNHLMDLVSSLGKLMAMDKEKPEFSSERKQLQKSCDEAEKSIKQLVLKSKEEFEKESVASLEMFDNDVVPDNPHDESGFKE